MKWSAGDKVMAIWPGSGLYYDAEIISVFKDKALVLFSDGTSMEVPQKYIKTQQSFVKRKRSKSASRSRRRSRSPARSPSRKGRSPQKKNDTSKQKKSRSVSRGRSTSTKKITHSLQSSSSETINSSDENKLSPSHRKVVQTTVTTVTTDARYLTRQRVKPYEKEHSFFDLHKKPQTELEYGGVLGAFLMYLTTPMMILYFLLIIDKAHWSITEFSNEMIPRSWDAYFSFEAFEIVLEFLFFHAIIYWLPFGSIIKGPAAVNGVRLKYRIGARYTFFFTALTFGSILYYKLPILKVHEELFRLAVASIVICFVANIAVYSASFYVPKYEINPGGDTGSFIYDSFIGRIHHPRIGELFDLKLFLYRPCMAGWLVMVWIEMFRVYSSSDGNYSIPFLLVSGSQVIYIFTVFFYDESQCPYMFDIKDEALGFPQWIGELTVVPFLYNLQVRYLADHASEYNLPFIVAFFLLGGVGLFMIIAAGLQKTSFRIDPYSYDSGIKSIPPTERGGSRLIVSGLWGFVRNPHYLGEIFVSLSWSLLCGFNHLLPWFYPVMVTVLLCQRTYRVEARNTKKHGAAWDKYCEQVKYRVIPGVF